MEICVLMDLNEKVFGSIMVKEIIGETPDESKSQEKFDNELKVLLNRLVGKTKEDLSYFLEEQINSDRVINSRPGAMALAQNKIRIFNKYSNKYKEEIRRKLETV